MQEYYLDEFRNRENYVKFIAYMLEHSDFFSLVFGHNMNNSAMFGSLDDFLQESVFADLSDGVLLLPDERYRLEVTASIAATCPAQELIDQIMTADAAEQPQLRLFAPHFVFAPCDSLSAALEIWLDGTRIGIIPLRLSAAVAEKPVQKSIVQRIFGG